LFLFLIVLLLFKKVLFYEYQIPFDVAGIAVIGSLVFGKVVLIFDAIPLVKK